MHTTVASLLFSLLYSYPLHFVGTQYMTVSGLKYFCKENVVLVVLHGQGSIVLQSLTDTEVDEQHQPLGLTLIYLLGHAD